MEAPDNTSPRNLRPNVNYRATLWAADSLPLATVLLRITDDLRQDCDGIFEILDVQTPMSPEYPGVAISVGNYQIAKIRPVDGSVKDDHGRIPFVWDDV